MNILYLLIAFILGFFIGKSTSKNTSLIDTPEEIRARHEESRIALSQRTEERKQKILEFMRQTETHNEELRVCYPEKDLKKITRRDIETLLDVSSKTAHTYLDLLEDENKILQEGSGRNTYYTLI
tara:strand:+ start:55 stop:429 length:375 start_codon:yes stop_codon:yes gene_type:complete